MRYFCIYWILLFRGVLGWVQPIGQRKGNEISRSVTNSPSRPSVLSVSLSPLGPLPAAALDVDDDSTFQPGPYITFGNSGIKLNWFGALYGALAIVLGTIWYIALSACELAYQMPNFQESVDPNFQVPIFCSHLWGMTLMSLTNCTPIVRGREHLSEIEGPVMFVANHASFIDIPYVCATIGWGNYKIVSKKELLEVPVLGKSLKMGGHVLLDRKNRRSQLESFKRGVQYLNDGVHLVAFAEGTRSDSGRLTSFKKGAFKMAEKANVPIIPLSIRNAHKVQPSDFCFPVTHSKKFPAEVVIGSPIYPEGKTDDEVTELVWNAIADNLQPWQKPLEDTPVVRSK